MRVSIAIATYNARQYIDDCLKSIFRQTFRDWRIIIVDNASEDGTVEHLRERYPDVTILRNFQNLGFGKANNQAIKFWESEYVLLCNQDAVLAPDFLERVVTFADSHSEYGSVGGKILRRPLTDAQSVDIRQPDTIDTAGLCITRSRRVFDRGAGEQDRGQYDTAGDVFGVSACLALYRRQALESIALPVSRGATAREYFDEQFFMYKEDVDLAWRLQRAGWPAYYLPTAEGEHVRGAADMSQYTTWRIVRHRQKKSRLTNRYSYRNHLLVLLKNEQWGNLLCDLPWIGWYELRKCAYILFWEPSSWGALFAVWAQLPAMLRKRRLIHRASSQSWRAMRQRFHLS